MLVYPKGLAKCWACAVIRDAGVYCNYCGSESPHDASYCSRCGRVLRPDLLAEIQRRNLIAEQEESARERYRGVGGWLLLFTLSLILFKPALIIVSFYNHFEPVNAIISAAIGGYGIYAGIELLVVKPHAVRDAKRYLLLVFAHNLLLLVLALSVISFGTDRKVTGSEVMPFFRGMLSAGLWRSYLRRSKRVAATYGLQSGSGSGRT